ncbi:hypothetical protein GLOIN_2v1761306 [Rhizophagus clarus]|uniref:Uncharacterized protein n=1 Tax=Rhizophagus clarus TaxID=94130 RepID=A0A8H3MFC5_9GLOM|nr:hypothetical protein GLOIN_2v1761306 [Rhizophagus clarus]
MAQNAVQLESALSNCKCKANEMEKESIFTGKTFGIITDAKECEERCITKLKAENAELRKESTEILNLRNKLSLFNAKITELKYKNAETLRTNTS